MDIFYFNITPLRNKINYINYLEKIESERKERIERYKRTDDKLRCLGAGILLNHIREKYNISDNVLYERYGKPYFENKKIHFNISHSGSFVVVAVSNYQLGVDIQQIKEDKHMIAEKHFLPQECDFINEAKDETEKTQRFCQIWTVKEAYLKYTGTGLRKPLNSFEVSMENNEPCLLGLKELKLVQFKLDDNYIITVCCDNRDEEVNVKCM